MTYLSKLTPAAALIAFTAMPLMAQTAPPTTETEDDVTEAYVGLTTLSRAQYLGAAEEETSVLPYLAFFNVYGFDFNGLALTHDTVEYGTGNGLGKWSLKAGPRAGFNFGRDGNDSATAQIVGDIDPSLLLGGFMRYTYGPVGLRIDAGQDVINGHDGAIVDISLGTQLPIGDLTFQPSVTASWGSENHNNAFFGVTQSQADSSTLTTYDAGSGFYAQSVNLLAWVDIGDKWQASTLVSYRTYNDLAFDSPILQAPDGSDDEVFALISFARRFEFNL